MIEQGELSLSLSSISARRISCSSAAHRIASHRIVSQCTAPPPPPPPSEAAHHRIALYCLALRGVNLNLTPEEKRQYYRLFQIADETNLGVITGEVAVSFFEKTGLPSDTLGQIWQMADTENRGLLTPTGFGIVMRLIGHAQAGRPLTEELAFQRELYDP
ncbi:UBA/TS-N domain-containing protein [Ascosphaera apis ARSEF 7405]|uniref:UBA/TS-N domain-containing protein n=1 Tax=Ascosphaera apis ARSEF 7405 TaxID=392613 RepID=A0A168DUV4_9EURO|nr:UBA/TS-N domain-containing protein [Ascosphaera apis ARSEF 7405]